MGIFDKIKNLFYDEEEIEIPVEQKKEDITIKSGNVAVIEKDVKNINDIKDVKDINNDEKIVNTQSQLKIEEPQKIEEINQVVSERDLVSTTQNFKFPIIFEDEDIAKIEKKETPKREKKEEEAKPQKNKYQKPVLDRKVIDEVVKKPKKFQPTPIISPIYGILDKNYEQQNTNKSKTNSLNNREKTLELNFDTIRQKAYGTLSDDLENELSKSEEKIDEIENKIDNILEENNLLSDLQEDPNNISDVEKMKDENLYNYEDFGVEYKIDDSKLNEETADLNTKKNKKNKEVELTEDLFNLIDSMYDK